VWSQTARKADHDATPPLAPRTLRRGARGGDAGRDGLLLINRRTDLVVVIVIGGRFIDPDNRRRDELGCLVIGVFDDCLRYRGRTGER
jgi:hypothetical protein